MNGLFSEKFFSARCRGKFAYYLNLYFLLIELRYDLSFCIELLPEVFYQTYE